MSKRSEKLKKLMSEGFKVSPALKEIPVHVETAPGISETWRMLELSGPDRDKWGNFTISKTKDGRVTNWENYQQTLLSMCLVDPQGKKPDIKRINELFSSTTIMELFEVSLDLSRLTLDDEETEEDLKNE